MARSKLQFHPKSRVVKKGYINQYSTLSSQEERQADFKLLYKKLNPAWDDGMVFLSQKLGQFIKTDAKVLDIGCGNGNYLIDENRRKISWATGIDINSKFTQKNICLDEIVIGNIESLPFTSTSFDFVVSLWVLEHVQAPQKVFDEVHRILKPGGKFLFITPNINFLPLRIIKLIPLKRLLIFINKTIYGRQKEDIFPTYYHANTIKKINYLTQEKFKKIILQTNSDPTYLSFNNFTFQLAIWIEKLFHLFNSDLFHPHIIGILEKP